MTDTAPAPAPVAGGPPEVPLGTNPRTVPPPPLQPPAAAPTPAPEAGAGDERNSAANQEAARSRQELQAIRDQYAWAAGMNDAQNQYVQQVATALQTGNGAMAMQLVQRLAQSMGVQPAQPAAPPQYQQPQYQQPQYGQPPAYQAEPQYQFDPNTGQWMPPQPPAFQPPPQQYQPAPGYGYQPDPLMQQAPAGLTPEQVQEMVSHSMQVFRVEQETVADLNRARNTLGVTQGDDIDEFARNKTSRMMAGGDTRPVSVIYSEAVNGIRTQISAPGASGGSAVAPPPPGVTPTPQHTPPVTHEEKVQVARERLRQAGLA